MTHVDPQLFIDPVSGALTRPGQQFDQRRLAWGPAASPPAVGKPVGARHAARHMLAQRAALRVPVGVIGPRDAGAAEVDWAYRIGHALHLDGYVVICGGRSGAMEAACHGVSDAGGQPIGILPDGDWSAANAHVSIALASGIGEARNAIIASASFALVAVGGGYGTLSEMALGLRLGRLVIAMPEALDVDGAVRCTTIEAALDRIARRYLALDGTN